MNSDTIPLMSGLVKDKTVFFWFRRDLRLEDNQGLKRALQSGLEVIPLFIFDTNILDKLEQNDARVNFIYDSLKVLDSELRKMKSSLLIQKGSPVEVWQSLMKKFDIEAVYCNKDYEPYAVRRDHIVKEKLWQKGVLFHLYKDQVIFEETEITTKNETPYTVFTPYKNKWLLLFDPKSHLKTNSKLIENKHFYKKLFPFPTLESIGFQKSTIKVKPYNLKELENYQLARDFPSKGCTSYISPYLRFGLLSIRKVVRLAFQKYPTFLNELVWREFFMQILFHYPRVVTENFRPKYNTIVWRNDEKEFESWCKGKTGYPLVDAGMRELNQTGYMHNRVRMITASFLCKHLLIDWRWGEAYFAQKLLDYDLSANNGNWQWAASTGCDAVPYFRIFNPEAQQKKFDPQGIYIRKWVTDLQEYTYPKPIVAHKEARNRALKVYKEALDT